MYKFLVSLIGLSLVTGLSGCQPYGTTTTTVVHHYDSVPVAPVVVQHVYTPRTYVRPMVVQHVHVYSAPVCSAPVCRVPVVSRPMIIHVHAGR